MTLTDRQRTDLELEFLAADLGKFSREAPLSTIKRELTRALHEAPFASPERVIGWVINCLDRVVTQWERPELHLDPKVTDGVRQAATIIAEAAARAGLSTPTQPVPRRPGDPASPAELAEVAADTVEVRLIDGTLVDRYEITDEAHEFTSGDTERITEALRAHPPRGAVVVASTADGQAPADWTPSDGGLTPSMFGGI